MEPTQVQSKVSRQMRRQIERRLQRIEVSPTPIKLTASTGLGIVLEVFNQSPLAKEFEQCLPERVSHRSVGSYMLGLMLLAGHLRGVENLSSMKRVWQDPYLEELFYDEVAAVRTIQDFLYDFEQDHIDKLNLFLNNMSKAIFEQLQRQMPKEKAPDKFIIDMDSSHHIHYGEAIEGLWYNYKNQWCLESHVAFDQLGLCHGIELRSGNTKPGTGAAGFIERIFTDHREQRLRRLEGTDFFRGDSAYCNQEVIKKCMSLGLNFTITAHKATTQWDRNMEKVGLSWEPWQYSAKDLAKASKSRQKLPQVDVARFHWHPSWAEGKLMFPMVLQRRWVPSVKLKDKAKKIGQHSFFELDTVKEDESGSWEYYAIVTNLDLTKYSLQEVVEHHRKRGHAENFVREAKYNYHLKNFPCESLMANRAWVIFAQVAHNLIRWISLLDNPDHPGFAKKIRDDFMFIPGRLVKTAQGLVLRVSEDFKEVIKKIEGWQFPGFNSARIFSTA